MKQEFRVKKVMVLPPQLKLLAVFSRKLGHDSMSEQCNHPHTESMSTRSFTQAWTHIHRQTVHTFFFL